MRECVCGSRDHAAVPDFQGFDYELVEVCPIVVARRARRDFWITVVAVVLVLGGFAYGVLR